MSKSIRSHCRVVGAAVMIMALLLALFRIDLSPALKQAGFPVKDIKRIDLWPISSPDGRFFYLDGEASSLDVESPVGPFRIHGAIDLDTRVPRFLPAEKTKGDLQT